MVPSLGPEALIVPELACRQSKRLEEEKKEKKTKKEKEETKHHKDNIYALFHRHR